MIAKTGAMIFFSPTGTTKKILHALFSGLEIDNPSIIDLTQTSRRNIGIDAIKEDIAVIGVPVYEETIPEVVADTLRKIKGRGQPAVLIAVYGNIGFGITLKELEAVASKAGFIVIAAAAFIGEHSFSNEVVSIAKGRPDNNDLGKAREFGIKVKNKLTEITDLKAVQKLQLPGSLPFIARVLPKNSAKFFTKDPIVDLIKCNRCGACVKVCPMSAIDEKKLKINTDKCLRCFACVKKCPEKARKISYKKQILVTRVLRINGGKRKEPMIFL
jgi:ferredoxin/methylmalonyl-CoA mutase cobalamin-binding subunit